MQAVRYVCLPCSGPARPGGLAAYKGRADVAVKWPSFRAGTSEAAIQASRSFFVQRVRARGWRFALFAQGNYCWRMRIDAATLAQSSHGQTRSVARANMDRPH